VADLVVQAMNPSYAYPHALVTTLLETARKQLFFAQHLPSLTNGGSNVGPFLEHLALAKPHAMVMHPGPINRGRELSSEVADSQRSVILNQVENGIAVRMAVLERVLA